MDGACEGGKGWYETECCSFPFTVSSTGTETRQFYDLYNSSVDERDFMEKEVCACALLHHLFSSYSG